jgi:hypothetical protein
VIRVCLILSFLLTTSITSAWALEAEGYIDKSGKSIIAPQYRRCDDFKNGHAIAEKFPANPFELDKSQLVQCILDKQGHELAAVKSPWLRPFSNTLYIDFAGGLRNVKGEKLFPDLSQTTDCSGGFAVVKRSGQDKLQTIDAQGKPLGAISSQYEVSVYLNDDETAEGLVMVTDKKTRLKGFANSKGNVVIKPKYQYERNFSEGLAQVQPDGSLLSGYINHSGDMVIPARYQTTHDFHEGLACVCEKGSWKYIDQKGKTAIQLPAACTLAGDFSDGMAALLMPASDQNNAAHPRWGFVDRSGKIVIQPRFVVDDTSFLELRFSEGLCAVPLKHNSDGHLYGYIDKTGKTVVEPKFNFARQFSEGLAAVKTGSRQFSSSEWKQAIQAKDTWARENMADVLVTAHKLVGLDSKGTLELLGQPEEKGKVSREAGDWFYALGKGGCGGGRVWLQVRFSNDRVKAFRLTGISKTSGEWQEK